MQKNRFGFIEIYRKYIAACSYISGEAIAEYGPAYEPLSFIL
jgi:hypothetical protein